MHSHSGYLQPKTTERATDRVALIGPNVHGSNHLMVGGYHFINLELPLDTSSSVDILDKQYKNVHVT